MNNKNRRQDKAMDSLLGIQYEMGAYFKDDGSFSYKRTDDIKESIEAIKQEVKKFEEEFTGVNPTKNLNAWLNNFDRLFLFLAETIKSSGSTPWNLSEIKTIKGIAEILSQQASKLNKKANLMFNTSLEYDPDSKRKTEDGLLFDQIIIDIMDLSKSCSNLCLELMSLEYSDETIDQQLIMNENIEGLTRRMTILTYVMAVVAALSLILASYSIFYDNRITDAISSQTSTLQLSVQEGVKEVTNNEAAHNEIVAGLVKENIELKSILDSMALEEGDSPT